MREFTVVGPNRPFDLLINAAIVLFAVFLSVFEYEGVLLDLLAFYSVFFATGYALVSVLFPGQTCLLAQSFTLPRAEKTHKISLLERIVLSVALSAFLVGVIGVLLTRGLELTMLTVSIELLVLTIVLTILAVYRRISWIRDPFVLHFTVGTNHKYTHAEKALTLISFVALIVFLAVAVDSLAKEPQQENFAEIYITGSDGTVESLPSEIVGTEYVKVSIVSHMAESAYFTLVVSDGLSYSQTLYFTQYDTISLTPAIGRSMSVLLDPGERFDLDLRFSGLSPGNHTIYFTLIGDEETLQLWMPVYVPHSE